MRTQSDAGPFASDLRNSFASPRAAFLLSAATASSRSRIRASACEDFAFSSFRSLSAGTKRNERRIIRGPFNEARLYARPARGQPPAPAANIIVLYQWLKKSPAAIRVMTLLAV